MGASVQITENEFAEKGVNQGMKKMIMVACIKVTAQAKALCPVDFGQLRNSIMWKLTNREGGFNDGSGGGGSLSRSTTKVKPTTAPNDQKIDKQPKESANRIDGYVGTNSDHWYPEFGTRYQVAQPFLRPAKELVMDGGKAAEIGKKYCREEMEKEFARRKETRKTI